MYSRQDWLYCLSESSIAKQNERHNNEQRCHKSKV
jgi:hypothetical protein